ncbi:MAG: hypothetical protein WCQ87_03505 [Parabacteroides sp.]
MAEDVILSAKMSDEELLASIDSTVKLGETKFSDFAVKINEILGNVGANVGNQISANFNSQIETMSAKIKELQAQMGSTPNNLASRGVNSNVISPIINENDLQAATSGAKQLSSSFKDSENSVKALKGELSSLDIAKQQTEEERVTLETLKRQKILEQEKILRSQISNESQKMAKAESSNRINIGGQNYSSAMAMEATSIQQRIEKIKALQNVQKNLSTTESSYGTQLASTNKEIYGLKKANQEALTSGVQLEQHNNKLITSFENLSRRLAFYTGVGALTGFVSQIYEIRGQYEMLERSMGSILGSFQEGSRLFTEIQQQALKSPLTVIDLTTTAKQLVAYNFSLNDVTNTTKRLADISTALGVPVERLSYNLGQVRAQGFLTARDARDFSNTGLSIVPKLAEMYSNLNGKIVTTSDVYGMLTKKMVPYSDVMKVINGVTDQGGMFFDFQAKQAETLKGQLGNLTDAWNMMLNQIGESNQGLLKGSISTARDLFTNWKTLVNVIEGLVVAFGAYKAGQLIVNETIGKSNVLLGQKIMAEKNAKLASLDRIAAIRTLTAEEQAERDSISRSSSLLGIRIRLSKQATAADYQAAFAKNGLTKTQAMWMVGLGRTNDASKTAIKNMGLMTDAEMSALTGANRVSTGLKLLGASIASAGRSLLAMAPMMAGIFAITALAEWKSQADQNVEDMSALNKSIADQAKETVDDINQYLKDNQPTIQILIKGGISSADNLKLWENLKDEIEKTSASADYFVTKLLAIQNVQSRNEAAINYLKIIRDTSDAMKGFADNDIMTTNSGPWGLFGEGMISDLKDYASNLKNINEWYDQIVKKREKNPESLQSIISETEKAGTGGASNIYSYINAKREAEKEIDETANMMSESLNKQGIFIDKNKEKFVEGLNEMKQQILKAHPEIQGAMLDLFNLRIDEKFGLNEAAWAKFMQVLKNTSSSAFSDITSDALDKWSGYNAKSNDKMSQGITQALKVLKSSSPDFYNEVYKIIQNAPDFKIRIGIGFNVNALSDFAKDFETRSAIFGGKFGKLVQSFAPTRDQNLTSWRESLQKDNDVANKQLADLSKVRGAYSDKQTKSLKDEVAARTAALKLYGQEADSDKIRASEQRKAGAARKKALSEEAVAVKNEIDLIDKLSSNYDKLTKAGMSQKDAVKSLADEYKRSIGGINSILGKYKLPAFNVNNFAGKGVSGEVDYLEKLRDAMKSKGLDKLKPDAFREVSVQIEKIKVEGKVYDLTKITEGLQKSLSNIKESYDLGVEIEADPELGQLFAGMFNIDTSKLPQNARDAVKLMQEEVNKALEQYNESNKTKLKSFDILSTRLAGAGNYAESNQIDVKSDLYKILASAQKQSQDLIKKESVDTEKIMTDFISKYGDYSDKVQNIEKERLQNIKKLNDFYNTDALKSQQAYRDKLDAINTGAQREKSTAAFDQFKNSDLYAKIFDNLDYISTSTLTRIKNKLNDLKTSMSNLSPEQLKQIVEQENKIESKLSSRNPFKNLSENIKQYITTLKNLKSAGDEALSAQSEYDNQENIVTALKEKITLISSTGNGNSTELEFLKMQLDTEEKILKAKKDKLDTTSKQITEEESILKIIGEQLKGAANKIQEAAQAAVSIRDDLKSVGVDLGDNINGAIDGFSKASEGVSTAVQSLLTGNIAGVISGVVKATIGLGQTAASLFGGNKKDYFTKLKASIDDLSKSIDNANEKLNKLLQNASGPQALSYYQQIIKSNKELEDSYRKAAEAAGKSGSSWGSHSYAYRTNKALSGDWEAISQLLGKPINSIQQMYGLTSDELELVATNMPDAWNKIDKGIRESLEDVIKYGDATQDAIDALQKAVTGMDFSDLASQFTDLFSNLDTTTEDFSKKFEDYMRSAIVRTIVYGEDFQKSMKNWMAEFTTAMADGTISLTEADHLRKEYTDMATAADARAKAAEAAAGLSTTSTSTLSSLQQGISSVTEDTAGALEATLNGMNGQIYQQTGMLQQIASSSEINLGVQSQMLLQMQESYKIQMSIQGLLSGWNNATGRAIRVEMIS